MKLSASTRSVVFVARLVLLTLPLVVGCSAKGVHVFKPESEAAHVRRDVMVGRWFGESTTKDGGTIQHIVHRREDGTYQVWFRLREAGGRLWQQSEIGLWGVSGSIYFTITRGWVGKDEVRPVDASDATFYDAYEIVGSDGELRYRSVELGDEYVVRRVPETFFFPVLAGA
jgi:hypothetical protein